MFILAIGLTFFSGAALVRRLDPDLDPARVVGYGFLAGSGLVVAILQCFSLAGLVWSRWPVLALLAAVAIAALAATKIRPEREPRRPAPDPVALGALAVVALFLAGHAIDAVAVPIGGWDFWAIWGMKGRFFFEARGIDWGMLRNPDYSFAHPQYPLLVPVYLAFVSIVTGAWDDRLLGLVFAAFTISTALVLFGTLRERVGARRAAFGLAIVLSPLMLPAIGYADGPLAAFLLAGIDALHRYRRHGGRKRAGLAAVLLGCAGLVKLEGVAAIGIVLALSLLRWRRLLIPSGFAAVIAASWPLLRVLKDVPGRNVFSVDRLADNLNRLGDLVTLLRASPPPAATFWLLLLVAIGIGARSLSKEEPFVLLSVLLQGIVYPSVYFFSLLPWQRHVPSSWPRLPGQILPLVALLGVVVLMHGLKETSRSRRVISFALLIALLVSGLELRYPRLVLREAAAVAGMYEKRPTVVDSSRIADMNPLYPRFLAAVAARTPERSVIALVHQPASRDHSEYAFYRAAYLLAPRRVVPAMLNRKTHSMDRTGEADFVAAWGARFGNTQPVWGGEGGAIYLVPAGDRSRAK